MLSFPLFRRDAVPAFKLLAVVAAILTMYSILIIMMFDPSIGKLLEQLQQSMPEMMNLFGMGALTSTLTEFIANYLYGFLMLLVPLLFIVPSTGRMLACRVDRGSMACLLAGPVGRRRIAGTAAAVLISGILLLDLFCTVLGLVWSGALFPGQLDVPAYLTLNLGVLCLHSLLSGLCYLFSCLFDDSRRYYAMAAGVPLVFYLLQMLKNMGGRLEWLQYLTPFTLFNPAAVLAGGGSVFPSMVVLVLFGAALFWLGAFLFTRRDLSV